jgi:predicted GIY-YIG superfamily endonuclease
MRPCADGASYGGHSADLDRRVAEPAAGGKCAYTETRRPVQWCWSQEFASREEALAAALQIQPWRRAKPPAVVSGDLLARRRAAKKTDGAADRQRTPQP